MNPEQRLKSVYISESSLNDPVTDQIINNLPRRIRKIVADDYDISSEIRGINPKQVLYLTRSKGETIKKCPGTAASYLCCRYQVINQTLNCPLNCVYCILQYYLNQPAAIIFTDFPKIFAELRSKMATQPKRFFRVGTGELGDSLAYYGSMLFARIAIEIFAEIPNGILELKTKTVNIDDLLALRHNGHTVLAWSLNPQPIIDEFELNTAPLIQRLDAAARAAKAGYLVAFHLDPMLIVPNWQSLYDAMLDELYSKIKPPQIAWISMGSLRYPPEMKDRMLAHYPNSVLPFGELICGLDGKMRYARPIRVPLYRRIYQKLTAVDKPPFIYFCMESQDVWQEVTGSAPTDNAQLDYWFAESLYRRFPGLVPELPLLNDYISND
jgi:spore photoproduct lyase